MDDPTEDESHVTMHVLIAIAQIIAAVTVVRNRGSRSKALAHPLCQQMTRRYRDILGNRTRAMMTWEEQERWMAAIMHDCLAELEAHK